MESKTVLTKKRLANELQEYFVDFATGYDRIMYDTTRGSYPDDKGC